MAAEELPRFDSIQMLRGFAAVFVVCVHAINVIDSAPPTWDRGWLNGMFAINEFGSAGVDLFFVISGFVMAHSTADLVGREDAVRFLSRRFWRVVPPFWLACALFVPFSGLIGFPPTTRSLANTASFVPLFADGPYVPPPLVVGWTLTFELIFYVIVASLIATPITPRRQFAIIATTSGLAVAGAFEHGGFLFNPLFGEFAFGVCVYSIWRRTPSRYWRIASAIVGSALLAVSVVAGWRFDTRLSAAVAGDGGVERLLTWGVPWALVLLGCVDLEFRGTWPASLAKTLGDSSYAIYLSHMFVVAPMMRLIGGMPPFCASDVLILAIIASATGLGIVVHRTLERPYLAWRRSRRIRTQPGMRDKRRTNAAQPA